MDESASSYRWILVAVGALISCVAIGAIFSLAVFLAPMSEATGWSRAGISTAMTFDFLAMGVAGFAWGAASDRVGPRIVVLAGAMLLGLGLVLAARAQSLVQFQLAYGALVGIASGAFFAPLFAAVSNWFDRHRGLAVSLVSVGFGVAPLTISPLARWLVSSYDWRFAMTAIGLLAWALIVPAALLLRRPPIALAPSGAAHERPRVLDALRSMPFAVFAVTYFFCCGTHSGPIFHTMSYAISCGIAPMVAVNIYGVEGLAGMGGRLALGLLADRFGPKPVLVGGLLVQALAVFAYVFISRAPEFYVLAVVLGGAYGGVMPVYAVLARAYFDPRILGTVLGAATMASSLGMALGPLAGGWVFDTYHAYRWLYVGSAALGLGAVVTALLFPAPAEARARAPGLQGA